MSKFNTNWPVYRMRQFARADRLARDLWRFTKDEVRRIMRRRVKPRFWGFMIAATLIVFLTGFAVMRLRYAYGAQRLERIRSERDALAAQADALGKQLEYARTDEYVIRVARDELNMIMPDEVRYVNGSR